MQRNAIRSIRVTARNTRWNLGIPSLVLEWRKLFSKEHLRADTIAALVLACVALPLSLAIALASSVLPSVGLTTAIVAGIVCALFGGTPLSVSGPAAAMAVLVGSVVEQYGMGGLLAAGLVCGILQLITGVSGLGRIIRYVPVTVVHGFTAGVGAIILIGQLPRALGLPPPDEAHVFDVVTHLGEFIAHTQLPALLVALSSLLIVLVLPRVAPKIPALLVAVVVPSAIAYALSLDIQTIGAIPRALPLPSFTAIDWHQLGPVFSSGLIIYAIASLETLLSSSSVDKLTGGKPHDPDQELIGQARQRQRSVTKKMNVRSQRGAFYRPQIH